MQRERERERESCCLPSFFPSFLPARPNCLPRPAAKTGGILIRRKNAPRRRLRRSDVHCSIHCSSLPPSFPSDFLHSFPPPASNFLFGSINSCPNFSGRKEGYEILADLPLEGTVPVSSKYNSAKVSHFHDTLPLCGSIFELFNAPIYS